MGAIRRLSKGRYRVNYYYWDEHGFRHRGRKWFHSREESLAFYAERVREYRQRKAAGSRQREHVTAAGFAASVYVPWAAANKRSWERAEKYILRHFLAHFGKRRLTEISPFDIEKWKIELQTKKGAASVRRSLNLVRSFFKAAHVGVKDRQGQKIGGGFIGINPMSAVSSPQIPPPTKPPTILTPDEIAALKPDGTRGVDLALFALRSGMRRGEILRLRHSHIDPVAEVIYIPHTKNDEPRTVPLHPSLKEIIDRQPKYDACDFVFAWNGKPVKDCKTTWRALKKRLGITRRLRLHDLRHTFGSYLAMNGVDIDERMALMGHKSYIAARIYTHYYTEKLRGSLDILSEAYEAAERSAKGQREGQKKGSVEDVAERAVS